MTTEEAARAAALKCMAFTGYTNTPERLEWCAKGMQGEISEALAALVADKDAEIERLTELVEYHARQSEVRGREISASYKALDSAGVCSGGSLSTRVGMLAAQLENLKNDSANLQIVHAHVAEAREMLGLKRSEHWCDSWGLRQRCVEVMSELAKANRCVKQIESTLVSKHGGEPLALLDELDAEREAHEATKQLLSRAQPLVCAMRCRQGHSTEHRELCVEIAEALKGGGE